MNTITSTDAVTTTTNVHSQPTTASTSSLFESLTAPLRARDCAPLSTTSTDNHSQSYSLTRNRNNHNDHNNRIANSKIHTKDSTKRNASDVFDKDKMSTAGKMASVSSKFNPVWIRETVLTAWATAMEPGEPQNRMLAWARTICGLMLLQHHHTTALFTATIVSLYPPIGRQVVKMMDDMINGLLSGLPAWNRYIQPVILLVVVIFLPNFPLLSTLSSVLAIKLAAEFTCRNYTKEERMTRSDPDDI